MSLYPAKEVGQLIKKYRLDQTMSQETLCKGICAISYLSKIESGLVAANPEIIKSLFNVLHINYITDELFIENARFNLDAFFKAYFFQYRDECKRLFSLLLADEKSYLVSPLMIDYLLAKAFDAFWHTPSLTKSIINDLKTYETSFTELQHYYFLFLQGYIAMEVDKDYTLAITLFTHTNRIHQTAPGLALLSLSYFLKGEYPLCVDTNEDAFKLAINEGNITWALNICLTQAGAYCNMKNTYLMLKYYNRALNLCEGIGDLIYKEDIYYNLGATFLTLKDYKKALSYCLQSLALSRLNHRENASLYHKLALIYLELNHKDDAKAYLELAYEVLDEDTPDDSIIMEKSLSMVKLRLEDDTYLYNPLYSELLEYVYGHIDQKLHYGFKQFHGNYLIACYKANRRYKDALHITEELYVEQPYYR